MATKVTQVFKNKESIGAFTQISQSNFQLGLSTITIGALQYTTDAVKTLDLSTIGLGGLDTGSLSGDTTYKVFVVAVSGDIGLVASTSSAPLGYSSYVDLGEEIKTDHKGWNFIRQDVEAGNIKNLIQNGAMDHFQRTTNINPVVSNQFAADRFRVTAVSPASGQVNMRNSTYSASPTNVPEDLHGISERSLAITNAATYSPGATQVWGLVQSIEANFFDLHGKKAVASFYIQSNHSATYSCIVNADGTDLYREYKAFTVQPGWQRINLVFDIPSRSEITWKENTDPALGLIIELAPGSSEVSADNTRIVNAPITTRGVIGQDNFFDTIGNELRLNGVMLYEFKGDFIDFKRAGANVAEELQLCQRYFEKTYLLSVSPGSVNESGMVYFAGSAGELDATRRPISFNTIKRVAPIVTTYSPTSATANRVRYNGTLESVCLSRWLSEKGGSVGWDNAASDNVSFQWTAECDF